MLVDKLLVWKVNRGSSRRFNIGYPKDHSGFWRWGFAEMGFEHKVSRILAHLNKFHKKSLDSCFLIRYIVFSSVKKRLRAETFSLLQGIQSP
jgi:hypothetical protein